MRSMALLLFVCMILAAAGLVPFPSGSISRLSPAELLCISPENGVTVRCDGGLAASGADLPTALTRLHQSAPGRLLLQTVDHVVYAGMEPDAEELLEAGLRPASRLYRSAVVPENLDALAEYLRSHGENVTLGALREMPWTAVPLLVQGAAGLYLP